MVETLRLAWILARTTFRQGLRGRMGFLAAAVGLAVVGLGNVFRRFEQNRELELRLVLESGLALSALLVLGTAVLLGSREVGQGADRRSVQALLTLPVARSGLYLGRYLGVCLTLLVYAAGLALAMQAVLWGRFGVVRVALGVHFATLFLEGAILAALASLLALGGSTVVAFFATVAIGLLAHAERVVMHLAAESGHAVLQLAASLGTAFLPAVGSLDVKAAVVRDLPVPWDLLRVGVAHGGLYLAAVLALGAAAYRRVEA